MTRKIAALLVTVVLAACGSADDEPTVMAPSATASPEPAAATTAALPVEPTAAPMVPTAPPADPVATLGTDAVRSITVGGMGAMYAPPTRCTINLAVNVQRGSVQEASQAGAAAGTSLVEALEAAGVNPEGIQTSEFWINPVYASNAYPTITGYEVHFGYQVTMPDIDSVGPALAGAIAAGGNDVRASSVRFETDSDGLMDAARTDAWADVRRRAEATASLAGEALGPVLDVHEKVLVTSPQGMMQGGEGDSASFDIPVSPGVAGVTVLLTVTYALGG